MKKSSFKKFFSKKIVIFFIIIIIILLMAVLFFNSDALSDKTTFTVINGTIEKSCDSECMIVKDETIIDYDKSSSIVTSIEDGTRVAKDGIVAVYKNSENNEYEESIQKIDEQISTLIKDLPYTYSTEIVNIDKQINLVIKEAYETNSYIKMLEYKNKINNLTSRKVEILANLSPDGSKIQELVKQRADIISKSKESSKNIKSNVSGIVTYKIDTLEGLLDSKNIESASFQDLDEFFLKYENTKNNEFGIKIVDNFKAYVVSKIDISMKDYAVSGKNYKLKLNDNANIEIPAYLLKTVQAEDKDYFYAVFEIYNYIEHLINSRIESLKIIWNTTQGMMVVKDAIKTSDDGRYSYVTLIYGGKYIDVPIKVKAESDVTCIIENLNDEEYVNLGLNKDLKIERYDIVLVE